MRKYEKKGLIEWWRGLDRLMVKRIESVAMKRRENMVETKIRKEKKL